jgi:hypothetical protein
MKPPEHPAGMGCGFRPKSHRQEAEAEEALIGLKREMLCGDASVAITGQGQAFGVQGMAGVGKTVLATALAHDSEVRRAFPDSIYWLTVDQKPNVLAELAFASGDGFEGDTAHRAGS